VIVSVLLALIVVLTVYVGSHRLSGLTTVAILAIAMAGISMVVVPGVASNAAAMLGVGRGTDLLLYFSVIAGLFVTAHFYFRTKSLEAQVIELVRAVSLREAEDQLRCYERPTLRTSSSR